jgi:hypothetical protein
MRIGFGASGYKVYSSPATGIGVARVWTERMVVNPTGNM